MYYCYCPWDLENSALVLNLTENRESITGWALKWQKCEDVKRLAAPYDRQQPVERDTCGTDTV